MSQGTLGRVVGRLDTIDEGEKNIDTSPCSSSRHVAAILAQPHADPRSKTARKRTRKSRWACSRPAKRTFVNVPSRTRFHQPNI